jgi:hypothetical protein
MGSRSRLPRVRISISAFAHAACIKEDHLRWIKATRHNSPMVRQRTDALTEHSAILLRRYFCGTDAASTAGLLKGLHLLLPVSTRTSVGMPARLGNPKDWHSPHQIDDDLNLSLSK